MPSIIHHVVRTSLPMSLSTVHRGAVLAALFMFATAVLQQGNVFPEGVIFSEDTGVSSNSACENSAGHLKLAANGEIHICTLDSASGSSHWRRVLSSESLNGNLSTCDGTVLSEIISALVDEVQTLREENTALRSPQLLQSDLFCAGGGDYNGNTATCSCYSDTEKGFYYGPGCAECDNGMGRDASNRNRCTTDVAPPSISVPSNPIQVFLDDPFEIPTPTLSDNIDTAGELNASLSVQHNVNTSAQGQYWIFMSVTDSSGNVGTLNISVSVIMALGYVEDFPGFSCKSLRDGDLAANGNVRSSGAYWIKPLSNEPAAQIYCDMETDGGGWTMFTRIQSNSLDQYMTGSVALNTMNSLLPMTLAKLPDTWFNAMNPAEYWSMCGGFHAVFLRDQNIAWTSNFGTHGNCPANNRYTGFRENPGDATVLSFSGYSGGCGGAQYTGSWLPLSGIHVAGGCCNGCYSGGQRGGSVTDSRYTHLTFTVDWNSEGYVFIR